MASLVYEREIGVGDTDSGAYYMKFSLLRGQLRPTYWKARLMGPLHDPVTWYGIYYTWTQVTQWD